MAPNYMWVVSTGRKPRPVSGRRREPRPQESVVSEIGKRGRDRDDRQATHSAAATSPPSYPTPPNPPIPPSTAIVPGSTGPVGSEGEVEAPCLAG